MELPTTNPENRPWAPSLFGKQLDVYNSYDPTLLVCGSRNSGKTTACLNKILRHMWEVPGALVFVVAKSKTLMKAGGSWDQLTNDVAATWCNSGMVGQKGKPIQFTTFTGDGTPGVVSDSTRTPYFSIRNYWGGESTAMLLSVVSDSEVANKVKSKYCSLVFIAELGMFDDNRIMSATMECLRMPHLLRPDLEINPSFQWIADANPHEELGDKSWYYQEFYIERLKTVWSEDPEENDEKRLIYSTMNCIELFAKDNPNITRLQMIRLKHTCQGDPYLYESWVLGKHGDGGQKRAILFGKTFIPDFHIVGGGQDEGDQIDVNPNSIGLYTGWDPGASVNHAAMILDRWPIEIDGIKLSGWSVLDEVVYINEELRIRDFAVEMWTKMKEIEARLGQKVNWTHWSDDSAINTYRPTSGSYDYAEIMAATRNEIHLQGVHKPDGSVRDRVTLLRRLLHQNRLFISSRCKHTIKMLSEAKAGEDSAKEPFQKSSPLKHQFDALTYPIYAESLNELSDDAFSRPQATKKTGSFSVEL